MRRRLAALFLAAFLALPPYPACVGKQRWTVKTRVVTFFSETDQNRHLVLRSRGKYMNAAARYKESRTNLH